ncbi:hypothetical protein DFH09DRAFT_1067402 [Mycena vulgaris]|nr:hypothetical protein DFH09DRAFT_1067402 [Mycena vulgaris]
MLITARNFSPGPPASQQLADDIPIVGVKMLLQVTPQAPRPEEQPELMGSSIVKAGRYSTPLKAAHCSGFKIPLTLPSCGFKCGIHFAQVASLSAPEDSWRLQVSDLTLIDLTTIDSKLAEMPPMRKTCRKYYFLTTAG